MNMTERINYLLQKYSENNSKQTFIEDYDLALA